MQREGDPDLNKMAQRVQNLIKLKKFYDQIDFRPEQRVAITKATIELTHPLGSSGLVENRSRSSNRIKNGAVVFNDDDRHDLSSHHSRPLYVTASITAVELK